MNSKSVGFRLGAVSVLVGLCGMSSAPARSQEGDAGGPRVETEDLILEWSDTPDPGEVEAITGEATKLYASIVELLGNPPEEKVTIVLGGSAERPGGAREYPRVDRRGRVLLFKFTPAFENYYGALAHEMVHAIRFHRRRTADWFFEEGFAEFVALRVDPSLSGFPWFDFPVTLVAGQWVVESQDIPLSILHQRHGEISLECAAQSYALRGAFFDWLGKRFGEAVVIRAGNEVQAGGTSEAYERYFGSSLGQLESEWRTALLEEYRSLEEVEASARRYRTESPIQYQKVCVRGEDF